MRHLLRRLPSALGVLVAASIVIFALLRMIPGDPAVSLAGPDATPESVEALRTKLGLDGSVLSQYFSWIGGLLSFDPGQSLASGASIGSMIGSALGNTLVLALTGLILALVIALTLALSSVLLDKAWWNNVVAGFTTLGVAVPNFVTGVLLVTLFGVVWHLLPAGGTPPGGLWAAPDITAQYLILPALCLALPMSASLTRFLTESMKSQWEQPYVTTARALGVPRRRIILRQVLPNALPTSVTVLGLQIGHLLGGAVLVESIFAWPGLGYLTERSISARDYPVVQVLLLVSVAVFVLVQILTDLIHTWLDPRIRLGGHA